MRLTACRKSSPVMQTWNPLTADLPMDYKYLSVLQLVEVAISSVQHCVSPQTERSHLPVPEGEGRETQPQRHRCIMCIMYS